MTTNTEAMEEKRLKTLEKQRAYYHKNKQQKNLDTGTND